MAKSKRRKKAKKRSKSSGSSKGKSSGGSSGGSSKGGGAMMGMRSGFKGIAGSVVGKEAKSKKTQRMVNLFWWIVTIVLGVVAVFVFYDRCSG